MNKIERVRFIEKELGEHFLLMKDDDMTRSGFNKYVDKVVVPYIVKYNLPCSRGERQEDRDHATFYLNIYKYSHKEFNEITEYLVKPIKTRGHNVELIHQDEGGIGMPKIMADHRPDFYFKCQKNSIGNWAVVQIDSKTSRVEVIFLKKRNLKVYSDYNAAVFATTPTYAVYLSRKKVRELNKLRARECPRSDGKGFLYRGKIGVEISDRKTAHISLEEIGKQRGVEKWEKENKNAHWVGPLKNVN